MVRTYHSAGEKKRLTPNLTVKKALNKFLIKSGIKLNSQTPVFYRWKKRQPKWTRNQRTGEFEPECSYLTVDYDGGLREWYLGYIVSSDNVNYATVNDITGECSLTALDRL